MSPLAENGLMRMRFEGVGSKAGSKHLADGASNRTCLRWTAQSSDRSVRNLSFLRLRAGSQYEDADRSERSYLQGTPRARIRPKIEECRT